MVLAASLASVAAAIPCSRVSIGGVPRAVAEHDEDALTLAFAAALPLVDELGARPRALVVTSLSRPLEEGGLAQTLAECLGIAGDDLHIEEHTGTTAAGGAALVSAMALATSGLAPVLVVLTDCHRTIDGVRTGDGAVAAIVESGEGLLGKLELLGSHVQALSDVWRPMGAVDATAGDRSLTSFAEDYGVVPLGGQDRILAGTTSKPLPGIGSIGSGEVLLRPLLQLAKHSADPVDFGTRAGGLSYMFRLTPTDRAARAASVVAATAAAGVVATDLPRSAATPVRSYDSLARAWRDRASVLRLEGFRDVATGEILYPATDRGFETTRKPYTIARRGCVFACTTDHIFDEAPIEMVIAEMDDGAHFYAQVTPGAVVGIGDPVELVLRRLYVTDKGLPRYFWKLRPTTESMVELGGESCR